MWAKDHLAGAGLPSFPSWRGRRRHSNGEPVDGGRASRPDWDILCRFPRPRNSQWTIFSNLDGESGTQLPQDCAGWDLWLLMRYRGGGQDTQASRAVRTALSSPTSGISAPERLQDAELLRMQRPLFSHGRQLRPCLLASASSVLNATMGVSHTTRYDSGALVDTQHESCILIRQKLLTFGPPRRTNNLGNLASRQLARHGHSR